MCGIIHLQAHSCDPCYLRLQKNSSHVWPSPCRQQLACHVDAANSSSPVQHQVTQEASEEGQRLGEGAQFSAYYSCEGSDAGEITLSSFESGMLCLLVLSLPIVLHRKRSGRSILPL